MNKTSFDFDLFVIGGGSAGVRMARWSKSLGAKVAICEEDRMGGTCVIKGCIPKKFMVYSSHFLHDIENMKPYGWHTENIKFDWSSFKKNRDQEISRLSHIYQNMLDKNEVKIFKGPGKITDPHTVTVGNKNYTAKKIVIAVGGRPYFPEIKGIEHTIDSNQFFNLNEQSKNVLILGGGYIASEFACILNGMGTKVTQLIRRDHILRGFDQSVRTFLHTEMTKKGINIITNDTIKMIEKIENNEMLYQTTLNSGEVLNNDLIICAMGRVPKIYGSDRPWTSNCPIEIDQNKRIKVDSHFMTTMENVYAIGDCSNQHNLTPVATAEGTILAESLFNNNFKQMSYQNIPSAVFTTPPLSTVGLTEEQAKNQYETIDIYESTFRPLKYSLTTSEEKFYIKMIVDQKSDLVVGIHIIGLDAPEIMQGFAVALKAGATKAHFDSTIGIHPSSAEELVTLREKVNTYKKM